VSGLTAQWRKSSHSSTNGSCVEVRTVEGMVQVRDTKDRGGPVLVFPARSWRGFIAALREGTFQR
jgi:hypothetical protein